MRTDRAQIVYGASGWRTVLSPAEILNVELQAAAGVLQSLGIGSAEHDRRAGTATPYLDKKL